ncbi:MAG TPA: pitrilysin family protein [Bryobacteraceae bacterium]|nr:pitrilysin family protein [Bryobacteraceae bacterium]
MKRLLILLLPCVLAAQQQATTPAPPRIPAAWTDIKFPKLREIQIPKIEETTLPNGMKIYLLENHELPLVRGTALVRTGNLFDPADKVGLATITGDAIRAGGTQTKTGDQLDEQLENIAASVESSIDESFGRVAFSTLKERTDEVLGIFHDVLTSPAFREDKIELAKTQLRGGISRRNDDAHAIAQREFTDAIYGPKTPYGWQMEYATVDNIKRDDIVAFYKRYFFPANIILAVQGDFSAPEMKAKLEKLFGDWNYNQPPVPPFPKVNHTPKPGIYVATKTDVTQTNFAMGQLGGVLSDKDYPALEVMGDILGGGFRSRLFQRVRTQLGYAYSVQADWGAAYDHPGIFEIAGSTKSASTADTLKAIETEVRRIRTEEVTEEELETAKQTVINSFVFNFDTPSKTLNRLLTYRYYGYPDDFIFQYQKALGNVTRADILRVAKQYIDPSAFVIVAAGNPKDFGTPLASLGLPVSNIDLTIPEPKKATVAVNPESVARGKAILAKAGEAMGGAGKLAAVKDFTQSAKIQLDPAAGGLVVNQTEQWLAPSHFREENILPFGKVITYSDGKTGWAATPQGVGPIPAAQIKQIQFETFRMWFPLILSDRDPQRTVADQGNGKVEISDKSGHSVLLSFDPRTGLPATATYAAPGNPNGAVEESYSDWQDAGGGIRVPRRIVLKQGGRHYADVTVTSVTANQGLTPDQVSKKP